MLQIIILAANLLAVEIQAFSPGIYFAESNGYNRVYLKHWDPYSGNGTLHPVTSSAYARVRFLKELLKTLFCYQCSYALCCQSNLLSPSSYLRSDRA